MNMTTPLTSFKLLSKVGTFDIVGSRYVYPYALNWNRLQFRTLNDFIFDNTLALES